MTHKKHICLVLFNTKINRKVQSYSPKLYPCQINLHYQFYYNENYLHFHLHMNWGIHRPAMNKCCSQTTSRKGEWIGSVENFYSMLQIKMNVDFKESCSYYCNVASLKKTGNSCSNKREVT